MRSLRRDGILRYPEAFLLTLAEHDTCDPEHDRVRLIAWGKFIAFGNAIAIGMIGVTPHGWASIRRRTELGTLYVVLNSQGTGAASDLLEAAVSYAHAKRHWQLELTVNETNTRATAFNRRHGFTQTGRLPNAVIGSNGPVHDLMLLRILPHPS